VTSAIAHPKALLPIDVTADGMVMDVNVPPQIADAPMLVRLSGRSIDVSLLLLNARSLISVRPSGKVTDARPVSANADAPMLVTPSGITIEPKVRFGCPLFEPWNMRLGISERPVPSVTEVKAFI